jgi:protein-disulfide isomerase
VVKKRSARNGGSKKRFYSALALIAIVGVALLAWLASRSKRTVTAVDPALPPAQAEGYLMGSENAPVQIIEFADFECPGCAQFATVTEPDVRKRIVEQGLASYRFYDFPLPQHRNSIPASSAAACANDQGKFWEMHDRIFAGQFDWNTQAVRNPKGIFEQYAKDIGLDADAWEACYDSGRHLAQIEANRREGERRMIGQTPTFIIGKRQIPGNLSYDELKAYVDSAAADAASGSPATTTAPATTPASPATPR